ncbi:MAG TPA: heavy metal-binding domain-containing protein, partial [Firmicutes bacterium]|nr:heavy metal-binding domain-containing protein [Bacillota bacterium]
LMTSVRDSAVEDMVNDAKNMGANAVIGIRFASSQIASGMAEILVYGTAVKI